MSKTYNQIAGQRPQRIEAISDGVFAVAITLLVLDIKVPVSEAIKSEHDLMAAFCGITPKLLTYFLSFMTLGIFWTGQSAQYIYIEKSDRNLNWLTLFFLMIVSLVPFTTAFLSEHLNFKFALVLYWLNIFLLGFSLYIHWAYASKKHFINIEGEERSVIDKAMKRRIVGGQTLYALGACLCLINNYVSIAAIIIVQLNYALGVFSPRSKK